MSEYEPPTTRLGKASEVLYAGYIFVRLRLHEFVRAVGLVDDEISETHMSHCHECDELQGWSHATLRPTDDGHHVVEQLDLACGHVDTETEMRLPDEVVQLIQMDAPEYVTVRDGEESA